MKPVATKSWNEDGTVRRPGGLRSAAALGAALALLLAAGCGEPRGGRADADLAARCADRAALERVYHSKRLGDKPPFEQALPPAAIERLVRLDLRKEAALQKVYGVTVTPEFVAAEVRRIETTTRAPETLAEIKSALGNDPARFARAMARPLAVEAALRARFDNDDALHAAPRCQAEAARAAALAARAGGPAAQVAALRRFGDVATNDWSRAARPAGSRTPAPPLPAPATRAAASGGPYTVEATAQLAQTLGGRDPGGESRTLYLEDLAPDLRRVLAVQLTAPGAVSAVLELPAGFLVYAATAVTPETLSAAALSVHKRSYEEWLSQQKEYGDETDSK
jgi:hypothetical protein